METTNNNFFRIKGFKIDEYVITQTSGKQLGMSAWSWPNMVRGKSDSRQHADWRALKMENKNNYSRLNYLISLEMNSLWSKKWPACQTWCQWCSWGTTTVTVVGNIWIPRRIKRNEVITKHCMLDVNQYWILSHKTEVRDTLLQFYSLNFSFIACVKVHFANF